MPRLLISVNTPEFFLSYSRNLAVGARAEGRDVWVLCPDGEQLNAIRTLGYSVVTIPMGRKSVGPLREIKTIWAMFKAVRSVAPDVYHGFTVKPVLYGTLVSRWLGVPQVIN